MQKQFKTKYMDIIETRKLGNKEMVLVVEDDLITTGKVFENDEFKAFTEFSTKTYAEGLPYNETYIEMAFQSLAEMEV